MTTAEQPSVDGWYLVELMGHRRLAGRLTEMQIAGEGFLRVDVMAGESDVPVITQFYRGGAVYALTPLTEELARRIGSRTRPEPVQPWELPAAKDGDDEEVWAG